MTHSKISNALRVIFSLWLSLSFLLGAVSPVAAQGRADTPALNNGDIEKAIKALAEQPLTSTPLRLRRLVVETLRPVASEQGGQNTLPLAMINRIVEDNAAYFFDEGRVTQVIVITHDRELTQRLVVLLKDKRASSEAKRVYLQGLLHLVLADRHLAELAVQDARIIIAGARQAGSLKQSDVHQAEAHLNTAELRLRNGLEALRRGDASSAVQHFEKAWEFSARVQAIWNLIYSGDFDQDGVVDVVEMRLGSSPFAADTDNDGLSDAYELNFLIPHTLPNAADTDLGNLKGAYTQWLARHERLAQGWQVIQEAAHVNAPGYDLVLARGGVYRLVEAKARASLSLANLHQYVRKHKVTGELTFNVDYFTRNLKQANPTDLLRVGNFEIEFYLNSLESARLAQELMAQMGGTIARYEYPPRSGLFHEVRIILTAVSR